MQPPDTLHNAAVWLVVGVLASFGWAAGAWLFELLTTPGKIVAAVVLLLIAALLVWGRV